MEREKHMPTDNMWGTPHTPAGQEGAQQPAAQPRQELQPEIQAQSQQVPTEAQSQIQQRSSQLGTQSQGELQQNAQPQPQLQPQVQAQTFAQQQRNESGGAPAETTSNAQIQAREQVHQTAQAQGQAQAQEQAQAQGQAFPTAQPQSQAQPWQGQARQQRAQQPTGQTQGGQQFRQQQQWQAPPQAYSAPPQQGAYATSVPYQPAIQQKKSHGWIVAIVIVVCLFLFSAFAVKSCTEAVATLPSTGASSGLDGLSGDTIGVIDLDGTIQYDGSMCSPEGLKKMLDDVQANSNVKAIVLRVNSGGGVATAGEEMAEYLRQFEKPVVVSSASINASAAYEISAQADYIYVAKSTEIGSIGTVMEVTDLSGLFEKLGISMETIASADSKDSSYGYRPLTDEEREYYQKMVNQINDMFIENVAVGRKMDENDVRKLATGLVFTGVDAVGNGLADAIGTREDAIKKAAELAGVTNYGTTNLALPSYDISSLAYLLGDTSSSTDELVAALRELQENRTK